HGAAHRRPPATVPVATGLADHDVLVIHITDLAQRGHAIEVNQADFAGRHTHLGVRVRLRHELRRGTGGAAELPALARVKLDIVDLRTSRDVPQRQGVADANRRLRPSYHGVPDPNAN